MQKNIQIFESAEFGKVRVVQKDGQPWWVLRDVCKALGLRSANNVAVRLDEDEKGVIPINTHGGKQNTTVVSESGLYATILRSDKSQARAFRKWTTSEVIPAIRKHVHTHPAFAKIPVDHLALDFTAHNRITTVVNEIMLT